MRLCAILFSYFPTGDMLKIKKHGLTSQGREKKGCLTQKLPKRRKNPIHPERVLLRASRLSQKRGSKHITSKGFNGGVSDKESLILFPTPTATSSLRSSRKSLKGLPVQFTGDAQIKTGREPKQKKGTCYTTREKEPLETAAAQNRSNQSTPEGEEKDHKKLAFSFGRKKTREKG